VLLVLMLCNVPIEAIEKDYRLSESELQPERQEKLEEIRSISLPDDFAECPAEWTRTVCAYINEELGGVETYLESCDVTREQQERLRRLLVVNSGGV
jgi:protein tyrosine/serine phosphatase